MIKSFFGWRAVPLAATLASFLMTFAAGPAQAASNSSTPVLPTKLAGLATVDTSMCFDQAFVQPFAAFNDNGFYTLMPGESADDFNGAGWTLSNGASIETTTLDDGATGQVLDLPGGSAAVSPLMCVRSNYPTARTMIRDAASGAGVQVYVSYAGTNTWEQPKTAGKVHGKSTAWTLSDSFNLQPYKVWTGWEVVRFGLVATGNHSEYQLYNLYVDPHMFK
jgi:hypothetical protein